jgi:hypothetical protein
MLALQTQETHGTLPSDWDPALMDEILKIDSSQAHYPAAQMFACYRSVDRGDTETALQHLENALAASSRSGAKKVCHWCCLEAAAASARERKNPAQARTWLARATKIQKPQSTFGIQAEIAMAEGRFDDAIQNWAAARGYIERRRLDSGLARFSKERIAQRERQCHIALREARAAGSPAPIEDDRPSPLSTERTPFPWMAIAAIALLALTILAAMMLR